MPSEALSFALAASIYPPALAAIIALGRGQEVRLRVVLLVIGAFFTVFVVGCIILLLFSQAHASKNDVRTPSAWVYILGGVIVLWLAWRLHRKPAKPKRPPEEREPSKIDRYLEGKWLVLLLGVILYVIPSPIFIGGLKAIADTHASTGTQVAYLIQMMLIMLWMIEIPMLVMIAFPERGTAILESINSWFGQHGRSIGEVALVLLAAYLLIVGVIEALH
ncbi:MAG TPA: GAP family protein [Solirubrobacteraceae bacterium]|nr:GAP family protein [Solirubrobacteraceae bacterium]